ncbi:MAG TPA: tetratricopeptide repeat protein [Pyrinomonadaceae bacterium]|nr:tetratricopeptide repeat protein [Pyrinomonadaceae bacterium]
MRGTDDKPRDPADALAACVRAFVGLEQKLPESTDDLTGLYREILSRKRALILLDNASDSAQVRLLLPPTGSALLVTSRNTMALPGMKTRLTLEQLPPDKARELLTEIVPRVTPDLADQICYLCGYLPLAVRAAGSLLEVTVDLDPADYAAQLRDERTRLERIGVDPLIGVDVEASFNLSYSLLEPEAASVFRHLAVFPAAFDARAEEYICDDPEHKYLSELVRRSLVLYDVATARYRLHDLVRLFADTELDEDERSWARWGHSAHYLDLLKQVSLLYEHGGEDQMRGLARFHSEWANIECGQAWAAKCMSENEVATRYSTYYAGAFNVLVIRLHPRECMKWIETGLAAARSLNLRSVEAGHLGNLGLLYSYMGEHRRSIEFHEQHLKIARELGDRRAEGMALGNLGHAYHTLGENGRAIEIGKQRLNTIREVGVGRDESNALMGLANAYLFSEQLSLAGELYKQALALARTHGYRDVEGEALANLGTIYLFGKQPEPDKAIELLEQALVVFRDLGKRRDEGHAFICLSDACCLKGDFPRALDYGHQAAAVAGEIGDRFNEGLAFLRIGQALGLLGRRQQAVTYAERALQSLEQLEHPFAATARAVLNALRE